jgi:peptide-methionine (S)-S-oxide reductase
MDEIKSESTETAVFGNGCFWCTEAVFQMLEGVIKVRSGYSGGKTIDPDYKAVCTGQTGHAECLEITYNKNIISFDDLLEVFWNTHDPTTLNRQGNDVGTQYRSVIFYMDELQKQVATDYMGQLNKSGVFPGLIVTSLEPFTRFYPAESYHQDYFLQNGSAPYCRFVVKPKVDKFKKTYTGRLKNPD